MIAFPAEQKQTFSCCVGDVKYHARAKYIPDPATGIYRLAMVQGFTFPMFNPREDRAAAKRGEPAEHAAAPIHALADVERATRRAKIAAFDKILCNPDLDTFATFTYSPEFINDKADWDACYQYLKNWLSNRVQRYGLKYIIVPERHKSGAIHFHGVMNSPALRLAPACSARTARRLTHCGKPLYNIADWRGGFTSAEIIGAAADDRVKVSKYIFKYMGKQTGQKIGGRYMLSGGDLALPVYDYADAADVFLGDKTPVYDRTVDLGEGRQYFEYSFL